MYLNPSPTELVYITSLIQVRFTIHALINPPLHYVVDFRALLLAVSCLGLLDHCISGLSLEESE